MPAIHIRGGTTPGRKTFLLKNPRNGRVIEYIPERGMVTIRVETNEPGGRSETFKRVSCREFAARTDALSRNVKQLRRHACEQSARARRFLGEAVELQRLVDCMAQALRAAIDQGDPIAMLRQGVGASAIRRPTYETPVAPLPTAPSTRPVAPTVRSVDPRSQLILPPGYTRAS